MIRRPPNSPLFPSPPLSRSLSHHGPEGVLHDLLRILAIAGDAASQPIRPLAVPGDETLRRHRLATPDRKSTRLNSSHSQISYAGFCLKKKKQTTEIYFTKLT